MTYVYLCFLAEIPFCSAIKGVHASNWRFFEVMLKCYGVNRDGGVDDQSPANTLLTGGGVGRFLQWPVRLILFLDASLAEQIWFCARLLAGVHTRIPFVRDGQWQYPIENPIYSFVTI